MRIAIVINTSWNIYNFRLCLVKAFIDQGHTVIAIAPEDEHTELLKEAGCRFVELKMNNKGMNPAEDLALLFRLKAIYKEQKPDVILQYTIKPNIYGSIAAAQLGIPTICNVSGLGTTFLSGSLLNTIAKSMYRFAFKRSNHVFFQNPDDRALFVSLGLVAEKKTGLLPGSGINLHSFQLCDSKVQPVRVLTFIGRLLFAKGIQEFLDATTHFENSRYPVRFVICGSIEDDAGLGITKAQLEPYLKQTNLDYLGKVDDIKQIIASSDCIVLPSYREGTPRSLIESLAMSKPIITTDVPGCKEVFNQKNGFLCEVQNTKSLIESIEKLMLVSDEDLLKMGLESRVFAEKKFNEQIVIDYYTKIIKNLTDGNK